MIQVLRHLIIYQLKIDDGEYIAVMGRSGSGKFTLLNIIGGMEKVTSGQYFCNEKEISSLTIKELDLFRKIISVLYSRIISL